MEGLNSQRQAKNEPIPILAGFSIICFAAVLILDRLTRL